MNIKARWQLFAEAFNAKPIRERSLILLGVLAIVYLTWDYFFAQPVNRQRALLEQRFATAKSALMTLSAEEQVYLKALNNNPGAAKQRELLSLQSQLGALDKELQSLSVGLLPVSLLPAVLYDVLDKSAHLKLLSFTKGVARELLLRDVSELDASIDTESATESAADLTSVDIASSDIKPVKNVGVFKHSVVIELEGSFFQVLDFLNRLERLKWRFYWASLDYRVLDFPQAVVTIEIYTLSTERGFLGG